MPASFVHNAGEMKSPTASTSAVMIELTAVLVALTANEPVVLTLEDGALLPSGPFESEHPTLQAGLRDVAWPGRFHVVKPGLVLDDAHNLAASERLVATWREYAPDERPAIIFGGLRDKNLAGMAAVLARLASAFFLVPVDNPRGMAPEALAALLPAGMPRRVFGSVAEALKAAEVHPGKVLVTGSLFLVGETLALLQSPAGPRHRSNQ